MSDGLLRRLPRRLSRLIPGRARLLLLLAVCAGVAGALGPLGAPEAHACAFDPRRPHAYEADQQRVAYGMAMDAVSTNALFSGNPFFSLPQIETGTRASRRDAAPFIPSVLLKAISWVESDMTMAQRSVRFDSIGEALVSFDCGHGMMQVTTGMTVPLGAGNKPSDRQALIATHYAFNAARGAQILAEKWNAAPEQRPIVGTDTASAPEVIENWYYAVWGYNGFTGPGSTMSNHPLDPQLASPRAAFRCDGTQARNRYPYQELVWGCLANPGQRNGQALWEDVDASLPDMTDPATFQAMSVANWRFPYRDMDIRTPTPAHIATTPALPSDFRARLLASPSLQTSNERVTIRLNDPGATGRATVNIRNSGTGVLSWLAESSENFVILTPPAGVALGTGAACTSGVCPHGTLTIEVNPTLLPASSASATVTVRSPNGGAGAVTIRVDVIADFEVGGPGTSRAR
ncbi:MAG: hypothetical protein M0R73_11450 [Dehalococcoidia bacterium]|nr:hypothetical protein [Dehalococcoidia bacterium]